MVRIVHEQAYPGASVSARGAGRVIVRCHCVSEAEWPHSTYDVLEQSQSHVFVAAE